MSENTVKIGVDGWYELALPSGCKVVMRGWSLGYNLKEVSFRSGDVDRIIRLLNHCLVSVDDPGPYTLTESSRLDWMDVLECDINAALIGARIATHGPEIQIKERCPNHRSPINKDGRMVPDPESCDGWIVPIENTVGDVFLHDSGFPLNLDDVIQNHIYLVPEEVVEKLASGENRFETDVAGKTLVFKIPTGQTLVDQAGKPKNLSDEKALAYNLACRLIEIDGITGQKNLESLLLSDQIHPQYLQAFQALGFWTGAIDNEIVVRCTRCGWMPENEGRVMEFPFEQLPEFISGPGVKLSNQPKRRKPKRAGL